MGRWIDNHPKVWIAVPVLLVLLIGLALVAGWPAEGKTSESVAREVATREPAPRATLTSRPPSRPVVAEIDVKDAIVAGISGYPEVLDAAIHQYGDQISLVLIIGYQTNEGRARELGDNFVRMAKSLLRDGGVGKRIGRGEYDYLVGVYYRNEELVAMGTKVGVADRLSW